jgi:hypothetical protein
VRIKKYLARNGKPTSHYWKQVKFESLYNELSSKYNINKKGRKYTYEK